MFVCCEYVFVYWMTLAVAAFRACLLPTARPRLQLHFSILRSASTRLMMKV